MPPVLHDPEQRSAGRIAAGKFQLIVIVDLIAVLEVDEDAAARSVVAALVCPEWSSPDLPSNAVVVFCLLLAMLSDRRSGSSADVVDDDSASLVCGADSLCCEVEVGASSLVPSSSDVSISSICTLLAD